TSSTARGAGARRRKRSRPRRWWRCAQWGRSTMAELPEIETLRRELDKELAGRKIKTVEVAAMKVIPRYRTKKAFTGLLENRKINGLERRGPLLVAKLDGADALMIDLGAGGQMLRAKSTKQALTKTTMVVITFTQGGQLRIVDPKGDAELWVI